MPDWRACKVVDPCLGSTQKLESIARQMPPSESKSSAIEDSFREPNSGPYIVDDYIVLGASSSQVWIGDLPSATTDDSTYRTDELAEPGEIQKQREQRLGGGAGLLNGDFPALSVPALELHGMSENL